MRSEASSPVKVMYLRSSQQPAGPAPATMERATRASTLPQIHLTRPMSVEVPDGIIPPEIDLASVETPDAIIARGSAPEVTPVFAGIRARLARRALRRNSIDRIEELAHSNEVMRSIGTAIFKGMSAGEKFERPENPLRPTTRHEIATVRKLQRNRRHYGEISGAAHKLSKSYAVDQSQPGKVKPPLPGGKPDFSRPGVRRSAAEVKSDRANERHYRHLQRIIHHADHEFSHKLQGPHEQAKRTIERRERLILKEQALSERVAANQRARQALKEEVRETTREGWAKTKQSAKKWIRKS